MSKLVHDLSHKKSIDNAENSSTRKQSIRSTVNNETIINSITGYENNLGDQLEQLERDAEIQARQIELSECLESVAQLVDLFKRTVITFELQIRNDWHKGNTVDRLLDTKAEKIVINKGLTKEQWNCLLYMTLGTGEIVELTKVSRKHLKKVYDKALRLLEDNEQKAVLALINSIEQYMSDKHLTDK